MRHGPRHVASANSTTGTAYSNLIHNSFSCGAVTPIPRHVRFAGYTATRRTNSAIAPERRHLGTNNITPTTNSATPLIKVQNRWRRSHGGTIASKTRGEQNARPRRANSGAETDCEAWTRSSLLISCGRCLRRTIDRWGATVKRCVSMTNPPWPIVTVQGCRLFTDHRFNHIMRIRKTGFHHKDRAIGSRAPNRKCEVKSSDCTAGISRSHNSCNTNWACRAATTPLQSNAPHQWSRLMAPKHPLKETHRQTLTRLTARRVVEPDDEWLSPIWGNY